MHWEMKGNVKRLILKDLHVTRVLSYPSAYKKSVLQSLYLCIHAKVTNNP